MDRFPGISGVSTMRTLRTEWRLVVTAAGIVAILVGSAGLLLTDAALVELDSVYAYSLLFGLASYALLVATKPETTDGDGGGDGRHENDDESGDEDDDDGDEGDANEDVENEAGD